MMNMQRVAFPIIACLLLWLGGWSGTPKNGEVDPEAMATAMQDETGIDDFLIAFQDAYNTGVPTTVAALYAEDARWLAAAGPVLQGRFVITLALMQFMRLLPPVLTLDSQDGIVVGDHAVTVGTYTLRGQGDDPNHLLGGAFMNLLHKDNDGWHIIGQQMNYDFAMQPRIWVGSLEVVEALPEDGTLGALAEAFATGYNAGDTTRLAELFTDDGWTAFDGRALTANGEVFAQVFPDGVGGPDQLTIHDVNTLELDDGLAGDIGWYELAPDGERARWGTYTLLARQNEAGDWRIHWLVMTGSPTIDTAQE